MADSLSVAVVDYDAGNTLSVTRALEKVGARVELTPDPERMLAADAVVLPGVGAFGDCMRKLRERGMDEACGEAVRAGKPFLGVCIALQVVFEALLELGAQLPLARMQRLLEFLLHGLLDFGA